MLPNESYSASEALFRAPLRPELDPAQLLDELRALRPLIDRLARLEAVVAELEQISVSEIQQVRRAAEENAALMARLEHIGPQLVRIQELIQLLDQLDVIVTRQ
jgi:hypothetical protein